MYFVLNILRLKKLNFTDLDTKVTVTHVHVVKIAYKGRILQWVACFN